MKLTSDPAYRTSTGPDPVAVDVGDDDAPAALAEAAGLELELDELLDELQAAAASMTLAHTSPVTIALRDARFMMTLPLGALRKMITGRTYQSTSNKGTSWMPNCNTTDRSR
jgi:hypothetical protein